MLCTGVKSHSLQSHSASLRLCYALALGCAAKVAYVWIAKLKVVAAPWRR